jgi:RHS repeat-associated protein
VYYYLLNAQGDVVGLIDSTGALVVQYTYDAWGRLISTTGTLATTLGVNNPLRYRGYVYDTETGLYYLQSRYYNPEMGRFINADSQLTSRSVTGLNLFAYCNNNPVIYVDTSGQFPWLVTIVLIGSALIGGGLGASSDRKLINPDESGTLTFGDRIANFFVGAALGLAAGGALVASGGVAGSFFAGSALQYIPLFGFTGLQTFAIGALAYNAVAIIVAPFLGIDMEPIEYEGIHDGYLSDINVDHK